MAYNKLIDARANGVAYENSAATNATNLQALIDANTSQGATIWFAEPVACNPITLKKNVYLLGNAMAGPKGMAPYGGGTPAFDKWPACAAFVITNTGTPFIKMQRNTGIEGFCFYYPSQVYSATVYTNLTTYPATLTYDTLQLEGVRIANCTFVGASKCMSFMGTDHGANSIGDIWIDSCYGYPLSAVQGGSVFLEMKHVADINRVTKCHVNPSVGANFLGSAGDGNGCPINEALWANLEINSGMTFYVESADDIMFAENFVYGTNTAFCFKNSYGSVTDCGGDANVNCLRIMGFTAQMGMIVTSFYGIPVGSNSAPDRNFCYFDGTASTLKLVGCHAHLSGGTAHSFVNIQGSGVQRLFLTDCTATGGTWSNTVDATNGSAVVTGTVTSY